MSCMTTCLRFPVQLNCNLRTIAVNLIIYATPKDAVPSYVVGVPHKDYKTSDTVASNASGTTNCFAPLTEVVYEKFGIVEDLMTTVHAMNSTQLNWTVHPVEARTDAVIAALPRTSSLRSLGLPRLSARLCLK